MKPYNTFNMVLACVLFTIIAGCSHHTPEAADNLAVANRSLIDSLVKGNVSYFESAVDSAKRDALAGGDSIRWANFVAQEAVGAYYLSRPADILLKSDSVINCLLRQPESETRDIILHKAYMSKGAYFSQYNFNPDSAIHYHRLGVEYASRTPDRRALLLALGNLADTYKLNTRLPEAVDYYHRAITQADSLGCTPAEYVSLYGGLAATYTALRDFDQSRIWWDKTMELYPMMIPYERFNNLNNYGNDFYYRHDYGGALKVFRRLDNYLDSLPQSDWERNFVAINLSDCYLHLNYPDSAAPLIEGAMSYFTDTVHHPVAISYLHTLLMRMHLLRGEYGEVENLIRRHPYSDTLRVEQQTSRLEVLADYYEASGHLRQAIDTRRKLTAIEDTLRSERVAQLAAARRIQYEADTEMLRLRAEKEASHAHMLRLWMWLVGAIALVAILIGLMVVLRIRSRRNEERMHSGMIALRMKSIRTRITPHFIFNALNHEILARQSGLPSRLKSIVALLRHQQYVAEELVIPLSDELEFVDDYVTVEQDAVEGETIYELKIEDGIDPKCVWIPSMTLQILVENAFKHGFRLMPAEVTKHLLIEVARTRGAIEISVTSNSTIAQTQTNTRLNPHGTGMRIIMQTLSFINSKTRGGLRFDAPRATDTPWGEGTRATLTIPDNLDLSQLNDQDS